MPATNAVSERSFSALCRLKIWLCTTATQPRLNWCMLLHIKRRPYQWQMWKMSLFQGMKVEYIYLDSSNDTNHGYLTAADDHEKSQRTTTCGCQRYCRSAHREASYMLRNWQWRGLERTRTSTSSSKRQNIEWVKRYITRSIKRFSSSCRQPLVSAIWECDSQVIQKCSDWGQASFKLHYTTEDLFTEMICTYVLEDIRCPLRSPQ